MLAQVDFSGSVVRRLKIYPFGNATTAVSCISVSGETEDSALDAEAHMVCKYASAIAENSLNCLYFFVFIVIVYLSLYPEAKS